MKKSSNDPVYKKVQLNFYYVVPDEYDAVEWTKECLYEDIHQRSFNLWNCIEVVDAAPGEESLVPEFVEEHIRECREEEELNEAESH